MPDPSLQTAFPLRAAIFDMDGVLYPYTPALKDAFDRAGINAVRQTLGATAQDLPDETVRGWIADSKRVHGDSLTGLGRAGHDIGRIFTLHHRLLCDQRLIGPCPRTAQAFAEAARAGLKVGVLTHASAEWMNHVLENIGVAPHIDPAHRACVENNGFLKKHRGPLALLEAMSRLGVSNLETAFVEDTLANLVPAHEAGLATLYVHGGKPLAELPEFVDAQVPDAAGALDLILRAMPRARGPQPDILSS